MSQIPLLVAALQHQTDWKSSVAVSAIPSPLILFWGAGLFAVMQYSTGEGIGFICVRIDFHDVHSHRQGESRCGGINFGNS